MICVRCVRYAYHVARVDAEHISIVLDQLSLLQNSYTRL